MIINKKEGRKYKKKEKWKRNSCGLAISSRRSRRQHPRSGSYIIAYMGLSLLFRIHLAVRERELAGAAHPDRANCIRHSIVQREEPR